MNSIIFAPVKNHIVWEGYSQTGVVIAAKSLKETLRLIFVQVVIYNIQMKANELRIGNRIYNTRGELDIVTLETLMYLQNYPNTLCQAKPNPLTEEWLLRFGFESLFNGAGYVKNHVEIGYNHNGYYIVASGLKIEYIHQLQNLYFALTSEELI